MVGRITEQEWDAMCARRTKRQKSATARGTERNRTGHTLST